MDFVFFLRTPDALLQIVYISFRVSPTSHADLVELPLDFSRVIVLFTSGTSFSTFFKYKQTFFILASEHKMYVNTEALSGICVLIHWFFS